jgi:N-acetylmuramoyl-L-alanine amidase
VTIGDRIKAAREAKGWTQKQLADEVANGVYQRDTYTGLNWSEVPSILVEMGYMSNAEEDENLCDPDYQALLIQGMVEGACAYFRE